MVMNRFTRIIKKGHFDQAVALVKSEIERFRAPQAIRLYSGFAAPIDTLVMEFEFENLAELDKHWADWYADPESQNFRDKFDEITETGGENHI